MREPHWTVCPWLCIAAAAPAPAQSPAPARTTAPAVSTSSSKPAQTPAQRQQAVDELNNLPCERVRCSRADHSPVCATGAGLAGCRPPEKGCTYTNGCFARCVYDAKVAYLGECTHPNSMRIVEDESGQGKAVVQQQQQQPRPAASSTPAASPAPRSGGCNCPWSFEPVCATVSACTIPGECLFPTRLQPCVDPMLMPSRGLLPAAQ